MAQHSIPRRIIQTGKTPELPLLEQACTTALKLLNPDFEYLFFDNAQVEDFIDTHFPHYRGVFDSFAVPVQKYDFFRYLAIYHLGGFYLDQDLLLAHPLSPLCQLGCVFPFEELTLHRFLRDQHGMDWEIGNYAFGAVAGHPFIGSIIANCVKTQENPVWAQAMWSSIPALFRDPFYVLDTTGPGLVSRTLAEFENAGEHITVLFPPDVCDTTHWHQFGDYGLHLQQGSWRKQTDFVTRLLTKWWTNRTRKAGLQQSRAQGPCRSLQRGTSPALLAEL